MIIYLFLLTWICHLYAFQLRNPVIISGHTKLKMTNVGSKTIVVSNLPADVNKLQLQESIIKQVLGCNRIYLPRNHTNGFLSFPTHEEAQAAVELLAGWQVGNNTLELKLKNNTVISSVVKFVNLESSVSTPLLKRICDTVVGNGSTRNITLLRDDKSVVVPAVPTDDKRFAFVTFVNSTLAALCVNKLDGSNLNNRVLKVKLIESHNKDINATSGSQKRQNSKFSLFVGGLHPACTPDMLREILNRTLGSTGYSEHNLCYDNAGAFRNFGFVGFATEADMLRGKDILNKEKLLGKPLSPELHYENSSLMYKLKTVVEYATSWFMNTLRRPFGRKQL